MKLKKTNKKYQEYLVSDKWKKIRQKALSQSQNKCQLCDSEEHLVVHHRRYDNIGHEDLSDLTVLCFDCHSFFHADRNFNIPIPLKLAREYKYDSNLGICIPLRNNEEYYVLTREISKFLQHLIDDFAVDMLDLSEANSTIAVGVAIHKIL